MLLYTRVNRVVRKQRKAWRRVEFGKQSMNVYPERGQLESQLQESELDDLSTRVGTDLAFELGDRRQRLGLMNKLKKGKERMVFV